ncbi:MAG: diguanylate cyclase [bacterium]
MEKLSVSLKNSRILSFLNRLADLLSGLSGLSLTAFDKAGEPLFASGRPDPVYAAISMTDQGAQETSHFMRHAIRTVFSRNELTILRGPTNQYHFFVPLIVEQQNVVLAAGALYTSKKDFEDFIKLSREKYRIEDAVISGWYKDLSLKDFSAIKTTAEDIQSVLSECVLAKYESDRTGKQYNFVKTILGIVTNLRSDLDAAEIFQIITQFPLLLLDLNTVSYSSYHEDLNCFITQTAAGLSAGHIRGVTFLRSGIIEEACQSGKFMSTSDIYEIHRIGLNYDINSLSIFPIQYRDTILGIFSVYDSELTESHVEILELFTKVIGYMLGTIQEQESQRKSFEHISSLSSLTNLLDPRAEEETLFTAIVENAGQITRAERASLMLVEDDVLNMKAVRGINRHVAGGIRVKMGEPVAGRVAATRQPLMVKNASKEAVLSGKSGSSYKTKSFISVPLVIGDRTIGVLNIADKITGDVFSEEDFQLIKSFASYASVVLESSQYFRLSEQMRELSITDSLTGIYNRRHFNTVFVNEIHRSTRHGFPFAFAIADIDNFKAFNDTEGHLVGDSVLKAISNIIRESLRSIDVAARFGGEEFSLILPQTERNEAFRIAERVRTNIKKFCPKFWKIYPEDSITVSIGISVFPDDGTDIKDLIKNADKALYMAKMQGKDRTVVFKK